MFFIPRSPRWLVMVGRREESATVLRRIGVTDVLELLLPFVAGLSYGSAIRIEIPAAQMLIAQP